MQVLPKTSFPKPCRLQLSRDGAETLPVLAIRKTLLSDCRFVSPNNRALHLQRHSQMTGRTTIHESQVCDDSLLLLNYSDSALPSAILNDKSSASHAWKWG